MFGSPARDPSVVPKPAKCCWEVTQATPWEVGALIGRRGGYVCDLCFWPAFNPPERRKFWPGGGGRGRDSGAVMRDSRHNKQQTVMRGGQPQHEPLTPPCAPVAIAVPCRAARRRAQARCRRRPGGGGVYGRQQTGVRAGIPSRRTRRIGRPAPKRDRSTRTHRRMRARTDRAARRLRIRRSTAPSRHLRNASNKRYGIRWAFMAFIQRFFSVKSCIFLSSFRM